MSKKIVHKKVLVTCRKEILLRCYEDDDLTQAVSEGWPDYQAFADNDIEEIETIPEKQALELLSEYEDDGRFAQWTFNTDNAKFHYTGFDE